MFLFYLNKSKFTKVWTREFSILSCSLMGNVFCQEIWQELGHGYTKIIYIQENNQISCYKISKENALFSEYYGQKIKKEKNYARKISDKLIKLSNSFSLFMDKNQVISIENYKDFLRLYNKFLCYHMSVYWSADFLKQEKEYKDEFKILSKAWVYNEKIYPQVDEFINKTLNSFKEADKNFLKNSTFHDFFSFFKEENNTTK